MMKRKITSEYGYSEEQKAFLIQHYKNPDLLIKDIVDKFNTKFGTNKSRNSIGDYMRKQGNIRDIYNKYFFEEQNNWLRDNCKGKSRKQITQEFNEHFGLKAKELAINSQLCRLGIKTDYRWKNHNINDYMHKINALPIGSERIIDNTIYIKWQDKISNRHDCFKTNWKPKHIWLWEKEKGKIPMKHRLVFLDNDKTNISIDNLMCVPFSVQSRLAIESIRSNNPEVTKSEIKLLTLYDTMQKKDNDTYQKFRRRTYYNEHKDEINEHRREKRRLND